MSEYNMTHTGRELDDAINKVKSGYVLPTEIYNIYSNVSDLDITMGKTLNVNIPNSPSKYVTETVYPLSSKENYTGVEAISSTALNSFRKVADNLYTKQDLQSKQIIIYNADGTIRREANISQFVDISENGSFCANMDCYVIHPEDVGKTFLWGEEETAVFPEAGTYLWYKPGHGMYAELYVTGTYKREVASNDFDVIVEGELNPLNLSVASLNKNYAEIAEELNLKKDVRLLLSIPLDENKVMTVLGTVETFRPSEGMIEFGIILDTTLSQNEGEQVYHFRITLWEDDSISTERKMLSGGGSGGEAVSPTVEITEIEGGHRVEITDADDTESFDVMNGVNGKEGRSIHYMNDGALYDNKSTYRLIYLTSEFPYSTFEDIQPNDLLINNVGSMLVVLDKEIVGNDKRISVKPRTQIKGDAFTYADFTPEQLESLKGKAFTYEDFTEEQLNALKGKAFTYDDFTPEQLEALKGKDGNDYVLTDADKSNIADIVLSELHTWNGGSY